MNSRPQRILIIRLSAIGDVVMASALLPALRRAYPKAHIAWLAEPAAAQLLHRHPLLDELIIWPRNDWQRLWRERHLIALAREARAFIRQLRRCRFDLVLDVQGLLKSGVWAWLSGAPRRIGLGAKEGSQYLMTQCVARSTSGKRIGAEYLKLATALGLPVDGFPMSIPVHSDGAARARQLLDERDIRPPYALICPFTTRPQKHWFEDRWANLAIRLHQQTGLAVVMLGGPGDTASARRLNAIADSRSEKPQANGLYNLVGKTSLGETAALIARGHLLIGVDTGLTHLGIAMNIPTLALFGSTCPYLDPATPRAKVLYHPLACSPCRRHPICDGVFNCMRLHDIDTVLYQARRLLAVSP